MEKRRVSGERTVDRHVLYLGEINDSQREVWLKTIEAFDEDHRQQRKLALFPADREIPAHAREMGVQVQLSKFQLKRPRQWGACWTFCRLWEQLKLDEFWRERLKDSHEGTSWYHVLMVSTCGTSFHCQGRSLFRPLDSPSDTGGSLRCRGNNSNRDIVSHICLVPALLRRVRVR